MWPQQGLCARCIQMFADTRILKFDYSVLPLNEYWAHLSPAVFKGHRVFFLKMFRPLQFRNMSIFAEQEFPIKMHAFLF